MSRHLSSKRLTLLVWFPRRHAIRTACQLSVIRRRARTTALAWPRFAGPGHRLATRRYHGACSPLSFPGAGRKCLGRRPGRASAFCARRTRCRRICLRHCGMHSKTDERYDYQQQATHLSCSITLKNVQKSSFPAHNAQTGEACFFAHRRLATRIAVFLFDKFDDVAVGISHERQHGASWFVGRG